MNVLLTGSTGFIGWHLTRALLARGDTVYTTARDNENPPQGIVIGNHFQLIDFSTLPRIDVLYHLAALTDTLITDKALMLRTNYVQALSLLDSAVLHDVGRIVVASSSAIYGDVPRPFREDGPVNPLNIYAESKLLLEEGATNLRCPVVCLRFANVYGQGEEHKGRSASMLGQIARAAARGETVRLFEWGEQARDWVPVADVVRICLAAGSHGVGVFNAGSGQATTFNDLAARFNAQVEYIPCPFSANYQSQTLCDMSKTRAVLLAQESR